MESDRGKTKKFRRCTCHAGMLEHDTFYPSFTSTIHSTQVHFVHAAPNKPTELYHSARQSAVLLTYRTQKSQQITTYAVYYRLLASFSSKTTDVLLLGHFFAGPGEQRRSKRYPTISRSMSWVWSLHKQTEAKHFKCLQHAIMIVIRYCRRYCTIIEGFHGYYKMLFTKIWTPWNSHIECIIHSLRTKLALIQLLY